MDQTLIKKNLMFHGIILFLTGLITGFAVQMTKNPRLAMAAHIEALMGGMFFILLGGIIWEHLKLNVKALKYVRLLFIYALYANWFFLLLAAIWGAGRSLPIAGKGFIAADWQELIVAIGVFSVSITILIAVIIILVGFRRKVD